LQALANIIAFDPPTSVARGHDRRLVEQLCQLRAGEPAGRRRDGVEVDAGGKRLRSAVHRQNLAPPLRGWQADRDLTREAPRAKQRRIEDIRAVRCRHDDNVVGARESVHSDEQLVERLLALGVSVMVTTSPADCVDLVDEDHRRRVGRRVLEQIAHSARADADELLDELRGARSVEGDACLAGQRAREHRLPGPRRPGGEQSRRHTCAHEREHLGRAKELDDLGELLDRLVASGDVGETRLGCRRRREFGVQDLEYRGVACLCL
jgi:hypothetical protein